MTDKEFVLTTMREYGMRRAQDLQETSEGMTGTELYEKEDYIPDFSAAVAKKNMLERKAGKTDGFLCRSSAGHIVRLIQNYNSDTYPQEPVHDGKLLHPQRPCVAIRAGQQCVGAGDGQCEVDGSWHD